MVREDDEDVDAVHNLEDNTDVEDSQEHKEAQHSEVRKLNPLNLSNSAKLYV